MKGIIFTVLVILLSCVVKYFKNIWGYVGIKIIKGGDHEVITLFSCNNSMKLNFITELDLLSVEYIFAPWLLSVSSRDSLGKRISDWKYRVNIAFACLSDVIHTLLQRMGYHLHLGKSVMPIIMITKQERTFKKNNPWRKQNIK